MEAQPPIETNNKELSPNFWFLSGVDPLLFKCASEIEIYQELETELAPWPIYPGQSLSRRTGTAGSE